MAAGVAALGALALALTFQDSVAEVFDAILDAGGESSREAALLGWAAGFSIPLYGLAVVSCRSPTRAFSSTWPLGVLLVVPQMAFMPGRSTTRRAGDIADEYSFLGSFFDTYYLSIPALLSVIATQVLVGYLDSLDSSGSQRLARLRSVPSVRIVRRAAVRGVVAAWVVGVLIYAVTGF